MQLIIAKRLIQPVAFILAGFAGDQWQAGQPGQFFQLGDVFADDQHAVTGFLLQQIEHYLAFARILRRDAKLLPARGQGVFHLSCAVLCQSQLGAIRRGDIALCFQFTPGYVVAFGAD